MCAMALQSSIGRSHKQQNSLLSLFVNKIRDPPAQRLRRKSPVNQAQTPQDGTTPDPDINADCLIDLDFSDLAYSTNSHTSEEASSVANEIRVSRKASCGR